MNTNPPSSTSPSQADGETTQPAGVVAAQRRSVLQGSSRQLQQTHADCLQLREEMQQALRTQQLFVARPTAQLLADVQSSLDDLIATTERFALVIDLTVAAVELLDNTTYSTAQLCVQEHVKGCQSQLAAVRRALADYPLLTDASLAQRVS